MSLEIFLVKKKNNTSFFSKASIWGEILWYWHLGSWCYGRTGRHAGEETDTFSRMLGRPFFWNWFVFWKKSGLLAEGSCMGGGYAGTEGSQFSVEGPWLQRNMVCLTFWSSRVRVCRWMKCWVTVTDSFSKPGEHTWYTGSQLTRSVANYWPTSVSKK